MSALWEGLIPRPPTETGPRLRPVTAPAPRLSRFPFLLVLIGIFGLGMAGLLMLNTTLQNQAFQSRALQRQATELAYIQADLERQLDANAAPPELARRASELGLRPNPHPAFLVLPEGRVVGEPKPVDGREQQVFVVKTPAEVEAERARAAAVKKAAQDRAAQQKAEVEKKKAEKKAAEKKKKKDKPRTGAERDED